MRARTRDVPHQMVGQKYLIFVVNSAQKLFCYIIYC